MRVAVYHRPEKEVSEEETARQLHELEEFCKARNLEISQRYLELPSADNRQRPVFVQLMKDASKKRFDVLVVWSFRNFRRFSGLKDVRYINYLKELGIRFISYKESFFDTATSYSDILSPMFEWIADEEAKTISERTKAGIERAKREGIVVGRPRSQVDGQAIVKLNLEGASLREISNKFGISKETVRRILKVHNSGKTSKGGKDE